jgi:hypothetical protein
MGGRLAGKRASRLTAADDDHGPDILNQQMLSVTELSETTAASILKNLTGVDVQITALLNFLRQSGSNEQVAKIVTMIESPMQGCRELLDQFAERQMGDAGLGFEQRSKIGEETVGVLTAPEGVNGIARQTKILSFNVSIEGARGRRRQRPFDHRDGNPNARVGSAEAVHRHPDAHRGVDAHGDGRSTRAGKSTRTFGTRRYRQDQ